MTEVPDLQLGGMPDFGDPSPDSSEWLENVDVEYMRKVRIHRPGQDEYVINPDGTVTNTVEINHK